MDRKLHQLIRVAKDNERVSRRLHALALAIVSIKGLDEALSSIQKLLHSDFPGTKVNIHLLSGLSSANVKECESIEISLLKSKLVLLGDTAVGKSSIVARYVNKDFYEF